MLFSSLEYIAPAYQVEQHPSMFTLVRVRVAVKKATGPGGEARDQRLLTVGLALSPVALG